MNQTCSIRASFGIFPAVLLVAFLTMMPAPAATTTTWTYSANLTPTFTTTASSANLVMSAGTYIVGQLVTLPAAGGIAAGTYYIVSVSGGTTITVSATPGGTAVSAISTTSGNTATYRYDLADATQWSAGVPSTSSLLANFGNPIASYPGVSVSGSRTLYGFTFSGAGNADLNVDGGASGTSVGTLNFATDDATTPVVTMNSSGGTRLVNFGSVKTINFSGSQGLILRSAIGTVTGSGLAATATVQTKQIRFSTATWTGFSGGITIDRGSVQLGTTSDQLPTSQDLTVGGAFSIANNVIADFGLAGKNQTVGNLNGNVWGRLRGAVATLTVGSGNATGGDYGGIIGQAVDGTLSAVNLTKTGTGTQTISGVIKSSGNVTVNGAGGTLFLTGTANLNSGSTTITAGTLKTSAANGFGDTTGISIGGSGILALRYDANVTFGKTTGGAAYNVSTTASGPVINVDQNTVAGTGQTFTLGTLTIGSTAATATTTFTGANNTGLILGAVTDTTTANGTVEFANNISGGGSLTMPSYTETRTGSPILKFSGTGNIFVTGAIAQNGVNSLAVTCTGSGLVSLSGNNTYNGNTTISSGTLALTGSGSIASTPTITVATGATFDISAVSPGSFALNGAGTLALNLNKTGATLTQGRVVLGTKNLTYGGALTVTATGGALAAGDSFNLITNTGTKNGWFSSVTLPALAAGISWDTNNLAANGVLDVYTFTTTALALSTPTNTAAVIAAPKLANHAASARSTPVAVSATTPAHGSAGVSGGVLTYTPTANYAGSDSFTVTFADGHGTQTMAVSVTVGSGNGGSLNVVYGPVISGGNFVVRFAGMPGTDYTVETNSVVGPGWLKEGNYTAPTTDTGFGIGVFEVSDPTGADTSRFYRTVWPSY